MTKKKGRGAGYRERSKSRVKTYEVTLPSQEVFVLRDPDLEKFAVSGVLPTVIAEKVEAAKSNNASDEEAFNQLSPAEKQKSFTFAKKLLQHICVDPKIVDDPKEDDELAIEDLDAEDMKFLLDWAKAGGGKAGELGNFQSGSNPVAGFDGKKQRAAGE
jgi:hypothetical protein